ncbi:MAG: radical SAM protein [Candidatus Helarchaeota archaeon]|nr:radical SAM protein [Candidatus Helarchaeota archaeon]
MPKFYPFAMINITNRCTLKCKHCFVYRETNPNRPTKQSEMPAEVMIKHIKKCRRKYGIYSCVFMGGEPLLRKDVLKLGVKLFPRNVITTNGTLPLINLGPKVKWVISLDGPEDINDEIRGIGCFQRVISTLNSLPDDFTGDLQCNCVITKKNQQCFEELIDILRQETPIRGICYSFYVPRKNDTSELAWQTLQERDPAVKKVLALKKKYPKFILNKELAFELQLSPNALEVTNNCPIKKYFVPLYLGDNGFEQPFCCYGNDVNCDLCGAWGAFHIAALIKMNPTFLLQDLE